MLQPGSSHSQQQPFHPLRRSSAQRLVFPSQQAQEQEKNLSRSLQNHPSEVTHSGLEITREMEP